MHFFHSLCTPYYDNQYPILNISGAVATNIAILHPNIFYLSTNWSSINKSDFWNFGNADVTVNNNLVNKTIYSPSPIGFSEPKTAAFTGFTTTGGITTNASQFNVSGAFNKGWNFYCQPMFQGNTIFFPSLGLRWYADGYLQRIEKKEGYYWSAGPTDATTAYLLAFDSGSISGIYTFNKGCGFISRPTFE